MGHPSEYFLKYSLAQAWSDDESSVTASSLNDSLKSFGLPYLSDTEYGRIRSAFSPPAGFRFHTPNHRETVEFMKQEKIFTLWNPTEDDQRVISDLVSGNMLIKHDLHILLMGRLPHEIIAQKLNLKYRLTPELTSRMVDTYHHYFWNVTNTPHAYWNDLMQGNPAKDALLASLYCGEQQALYRAGFSPSVDGGRALKEAFRQSYFRLEYLRFLPDGKDVMTTFSTITSRLLGLYELLYSEGGGLHEQLKMFRQIMMKHKDPDIKAIDTIIDKVAGGSYSGDGEDNGNAKKDEEKGDQDE